MSQTRIVAYGNFCLVNNIYEKPSFGLGELSQTRIVAMETLCLVDNIYEKPPLGDRFCRPPSFFPGNHITFPESRGAFPESHTVFLEDQAVFPGKFINSEISSLQNLHA